MSTGCRCCGNPAALAEVVIRGLYVGREDGIAAASTELVHNQQAENGTPEVADLVIASGVHVAGKEELALGISNAFTLLHADGTLLIRSPKAAGQDREDSPSANDLVDLALEAGFDRNKALFFDALAKWSRDAPPTPLLSAVFRK